MDIICGGFPCQAFSIAGNRRGFEDTRGTLFFEIARFASILRPKYLLLENVKGLLNHENGITFETIISTLDELGYNVEWESITAKNFGVPKIGNVCSLSDILEENVPEEFSSLKKVASKLLQSKNSTAIPLQPDTETHKAQGRTLLKVNPQKVRSIGNIHPSGNGMKWRGL